VDLDGDGYDEVISGQYSPGLVNVWQGVDGGFGAHSYLAETTFGEDAVLADLGFSDTPMETWMATANFADWDGDGDFDMVVGDVKGGVSLCLNLGSPTAPRFGARAPLKVGDAPMKGAGKTDPLPVDWDGDGRLDILCGTESGDVFFFRRLADGGFAAPVSALTGAPREASYRATSAAMKEEGLEIGFRTRVAVDDWNEDGLLDLLVGNVFQDEEEQTQGHVFVCLRQAQPAPPSNPLARAKEVARMAPAPAVTEDQPVAFAALLVPDADDPRRGTAVVRANLAPGWHLYADLPASSPYRATELELLLPEGLRAVGDWQLPRGRPVELGSKLRVWTGDRLFLQRVEADQPLASSAVQCRLRYQVCNEELCFPEAEVVVELSVAGG